jgi:hypothetical protein
MGCSSRLIAQLATTSTPALGLLFVVLLQLVPGHLAVPRPLKHEMKASAAAAVTSGGCSVLGLCCQGKNNTCRAEGPRMSNKDSFTCFCDSACGELGDCCTDYKQTCLPVDCELGEWQDWGECDARCGPGVKQRTRPVVVRPMNGGRPCEPTVEKAACDGTRCKYPRAPGGIEELRETAKILPAQFGPWRYDKTYNPYMDIRKNLFQHYEAKLDDRDMPSYCAEYELIESRPACQSPESSTAVLPWTQPLAKGATVCVECQPLAMRRKLGGRCRGHGVAGKETRWSAATAHGCDGQWVMKSVHRDCRCNPHSQLSFIFI